MAEKTSCGTSPALPQASAISRGCALPFTAAKRAAPHCTASRWKGIRVAARPVHSTLSSSPSARLTVTWSSFPSGTFSLRVMA